MVVFSAIGEVHPAPDLQLVSTRRQLIPQDLETWASGRDAILSMADQIGSARVYIPRFICPALPLFFGKFAEVVWYEDCIDTSSVKFETAPKTGDWLLAVNWFGLGFENKWRSWSKYNPGVCILEDHTLSPFDFFESELIGEAAFCSLRKFLPLPDGALLRRRRGARPAACKPGGRMPGFSAQILSAMNLRAIRPEAAGNWKKLHLAGERELFFKTGLERMSPLSHSMLAVLDRQKILKCLRAKAESGISKMMEVYPKGKVLEGFIPFLTCSDGEAAAAQKAFSRANIEHAIFWSEKLWQD